MGQNCSTDAGNRNDRFGQNRAPGSPPSAARPRGRFYMLRWLLRPCLRKSRIIFHYGKSLEVLVKSSCAPRSTTGARQRCRLAEPACGAAVGTCGAAR